MAEAPEPEKQPLEGGTADTGTRVTQGFYPVIPPEELRRSLLLAALASTCGAGFFSIVQGTIFNFFLEDLGLRERLPYFMGLWYIAGLGNLLGSWIQERWGARKKLFFYTVSASRLIWLAIGLIPLYWPELIKNQRSFGWLSVALLVFYFVHAIGGNAWLSWMGDLVPPEKQAAFWSWRQVCVALSSAVTRLGFGYYLEHHRYMGAYAVIFGITTAIGLIDAILFMFVVHRRPKLHPQRRSVVAELVRRLDEPAFRRLCTVYVMWIMAHCIYLPTYFIFMRVHMQMGVAHISLVETIGLISFTAFSLLWGKFSEHHGHRAALILCLVIQSLSGILFIFARPHDHWLIYIAVTIWNIGFCGVNLFMFPMLFSYTRGKGGGRAVALGAFSTLMSVASFIACILTDQVLYRAAAWLVHKEAAISQVPVAYVPMGQAYLVVILFTVVLRIIATGIAWKLPQTEAENAPGIVILQFFTTNPIRAAFSFMRYAAGRQDWEGAEGDTKIMERRKSRIETLKRKDPEDSGE